MNEKKYIFSLIKNNIKCTTNIYKDSKNIISILIKTDKNNNFYSYSTKFKETKILCKDKILDLLEYFNKNKVSITEINDRELILEIDVGIENYTIKDSSTKLNFIKIINNENEKGNRMSISIKKNEYYILWRDPCFEENNGYYYDLQDLISFCFEEVNMSVYCVSSTESALKFLKNRINDKIIFITSIGKSQQGRRFIEIIREIYGFDIIVLFYSNNRDHFSWIKDFPNCLYNEEEEIFKEYITKYNEEDLKKLRNKNNKKFEGLSLKKFTNDFFQYSKINKSIQMPNIQFKIYGKNKKKYVCMTKNGKIKLKNEAIEDCIWDITFLGNTITFYSNKFYLNDKDGKIEGYQFMKVWEFIKINDGYNFKSPSQKFLSMDNNEIKADKCNAGDNEIFQLINILENPEKEESNPFLLEKVVSHNSSYFSNKIVDLTDSKKLEESISSNIFIYGKV